ncbi:MAG: XdhC family aldehyde oxidoreductase maturation factor [Anaerolineaceae bacterium]
MKQLIQEMSKIFSTGQSFVLATVVTNNGSVPREAGAKMLVRPDGSTAGTVGGGILEARVEELARDILKTHACVVREFKFTGKDAATMDAICGGQVEVLVEWFDGADASTGALLKDMQDSVSSRRKAWLVTELPDDGANRPGRCLVHLHGEITGGLPAGMDEETVVACSRPNLLSVGPRRVMVEPLDPSGSVFIFGAGHVSRSLAEFTRAVGFWTVVLDDRPEFANRERFPTVDQIIVLDSFNGVMDKIAVDGDSYLVIVTRGHLNDRHVLGQALKTGAGYIGMIGSKRKIALIYEQLLKDGFTEEDIRRVTAPIGLDIAAETPEEIGISIAAELIKMRAKR